MFGRNEPQQHWSVHAEFTISHPGVSDPENLPQTSTEQGDNGVRMTYTWTSQTPNNQSNTSWSSRSTPPPPPSLQPAHSSSPTNRSTYSDIQKPSSFQKGNLLFTSTPPPRRPFSLGVQDSGYGSDLLSPNSLGCYRRPIQPYNRKCRSTCNIVLSTNIHDENRIDDKTDSVHTQCGRTQSLRCQTPTLHCDRKENYYGCGDPWCHHLHYGDDFSCTGGGGGGGRVSPVLETCEDCLSNNSGQSSLSKTSRTNTTLSTVRCCDHYRTSSLPPEVEQRKDACVQTFEMIDKCTSPFLKVDTYKQKNERNKQEKNNKKKYSSNYRRRTEPIFQRSQSPSSITPDSLENQRMPLRRVIRSPKLNKLASAINKEKRESSATDSKSNDPSKKPRTVHIDVYCTGTEMESSSSDGGSSDTTDNELASTPQTVFESKNMKITHKRADQHQLPFNIQKSQSSDQNLKTKTEENDETDDDEGASTAYPSKLSSYSTIRDFSSSISTVPRSWTNYSMSSCTVPDDNDSVANTSWKDTFSDIESLLQSRSSLAPTESLDFVPRKLYEKNPSIDETPEIEKNLLETPSNISLQASDSFEYADSEDRLRIKRMEELWRNKSPQQFNKLWKSPQTERKHMLQQKKIQEYLQKRLKDKDLPNWKSKDSDTEGSDDLETGWSFIGNQNIDSKSKQVTDNKCEEQSLKETKKPEKLSIQANLESKSLDPDRGSLSDSSNSPKSPSFQQRFSLDPNLRAPFTILPGIYTEQRAVAKKFGSIVNAFRKPGHHVGPAKNPDCLCDHCQRYFETFQRNRTRSVGDTPVTNWKNLNPNPQIQSTSNRSVPTQLCTNFQ